MKPSGLMLITHINFCSSTWSISAVVLSTHCWSPVPPARHGCVIGGGAQGMVGHLVSSGESKGPAALLWGRRRNRKQGPTAHLLPAAAAAGCNAVAQQVLWEEVPRHS